MKRTWTEFESAEPTPGAAYKLNKNERMWRNNLYQVIEEQLEPIEGWPPLTYLSIKRLDRNPIHDWRDLQRIKNELVGEEAEGVELYPAESRLVDNANQYHMYCVKPPYKWPFGFRERSISEGSYRGSKQRPWPEGERPPDTLSEEEANALIEARLKERGGQA